MALLILLAAIGLWQWTQLSHLIQKDNWFFGFLNKLSPANNAQRVLITIAVPVLVLATVFALLSFENFFSGVLVSVMSLVVLIYSLGRGDWDIQVSRLRAAWHDNNSDRALSLIQSWQSTPIESTQVPEEGEPVSNTQQGVMEQDSSVASTGWQIEVMRALAYHGFERSFAVIFWFVLLGPIGALIYRLSHLLTQSPSLNTAESQYAHKWLWLIEWPVLRLLGLTFALTGHFMSCIEHWRICAFCGQRSTQAVLSHYIQGALHIDAANPEVDPLACKNGFCDVVISLSAIVSLYSRTLLFWVCAITMLWLF